MKYKAFIFDLDGTLLDTLPDLVNVTNTALAEFGYPTHSPEQILTYVGDGAASLISQAVPAGTSPEQFEAVFARFKDLYAEIGLMYTKEFEGMSEALAALSDGGIKLGVMSNKFEQGVLDVVDKFFDGVFDSVHGETAKIPRKPDPTGLLLCAEEMGVSPEECLFFGDSASDIEAGKNAGMFTAAVMWGYQPHERLLASAANYVVETPAGIALIATEGKCDGAGD